MIATKNEIKFMARRLENPRRIVIEFVVGKRKLMEVSNK